MKFALLFLVAACSPAATPTPQDQADVAVYAGELEVCVAKSATLEDSRVCRCKAAKAHGRTCP